ncbi:carboxymuconolactone decarboxylase family protein [Siphonobacter aquaeclarae]|uniref:Alkylhydroperoxidase AhpD family core domain-containing protein n=1 Tax=Siphonobacter aquaeclarae TaxID=563176 RepID=A0A1G9RZK4_9BACT|nr:carboxymuconolactone decarboxylase family protein [Siphonobacter aquaeclarae]SDM28646.1 alkylhydroperoxidase AhpD family core domain-containing protein [Siphonobacter aquaeclarae]
MERIPSSELPQGLMAAMRHVQAYVDRSGLDRKLLELMRTRVSQLNGCAYCLDMHYKEAIDAGETPLRLISVSVWREAPYYSDAERAVFAYAEFLTRMPEAEEADPHYAALGNHFTRDEIAFLTLAVTQINGWNRLVRSFGFVAGNYEVRK